MSKILFFFQEIQERSQITNHKLSSLQIYFRGAARVVFLSERLLTAARTSA